MTQMKKEIAADEKLCVFPSQVRFSSAASLFKSASSAFPLL
jgi:hypothetical protein